jgi:hypothetical protein
VCYSGRCRNELESGACGGRQYGPCPESVEDYEEAEREWEEDKAFAADYQAEEQWW